MVSKCSRGFAWRCDGEVEVEVGGEGGVAAASAARPKQVSSICAMSLNSRSQENAAPARWPRAVTNRYSRAAKQSIHRYSGQLLLPVDNRETTPASSRASNIDAFLARSPLQMASIAFSRHPAALLAVASLSLPRNRNSPRMCALLARLHLIKTWTRLSQQQRLQLNTALYLPRLPNDLN